jgi:hypothetical protein
VESLSYTLESKHGILGKKSIAESKMKNSIPMAVCMGSLLFIFAWLLTACPADTWYELKCYDICRTRNGVDEISCGTAHLFGIYGNIEVTNGCRCVCLNGEYKNIYLREMSAEECK